MIRVTIELVPHGDESRARPIGQIYIANDGSGDIKTGSYNALLVKERALAKPLAALGQSDIWKRARVASFPRQRLGAYDLLYRVLHAAIGSRNKVAT